MVHSPMPRCHYAVDAHDVITSVSPTWLAFARENGAPELTEQAVVGRSLWKFIDGRLTIQLYRVVLQRVRTIAARIVLPFRCDSPTLRRYMRLEISRQAEGCVQFEGLLLRVEPTEWLKVLDTRATRSRDSLTLCSCCKRVLIEPCGWLEIEAAVARLHLFEERSVPQLCHSVCPECLVVADVLPSPCDSGELPGSLAEP
jgi:hypothetical protein